MSSMVGMLQSPQDDKAALKEIHDVLCQHYELISQAFLFYPTGSSADVFHMGLNNFTGLLEDCKVCIPQNPPEVPKPTNTTKPCSTIRLPQTIGQL